jgi:predicted RNase H-like HicB family nuclease
MKHQFTSVIEKRGKWYIAYIEEIPGVHTQGRTLAEARRNLKETLTMVMEANRELAAKQRSEDAVREPITVSICVRGMKRRNCLVISPTIGVNCCAKVEDIPSISIHSPALPRASHGTQKLMIFLRGRSAPI